MKSKNYLLHLQSTQTGREKLPCHQAECLTIIWAVGNFHLYLMAMKFKAFTDHFTVQWLKSKRTSSALLRGLWMYSESSSQQVTISCQQFQLPSHRSPSTSRWSCPSPEYPAWQGSLQRCCQQPSRHHSSGWGCPLEIILRSLQLQSWEAHMPQGCLFLPSVPNWIWPWPPEEDLRHHRLH